MSQEDKATYIETTNTRKRARILGDECSSQQRRILGDECSSQQPRKQKKKWLLRAAKKDRKQGGMITSEAHQLKAPTKCNHCGANKFEHETPSFCCDQGQIKLAAEAVPHELYKLLTDSDPLSVEFRKNIRAFNSAFSFTTMGATIDKELANSKEGVYTFKAQGQIYHNLPSLTPRENRPCYLQLYYYDTANELENRRRNLPGVNLTEGIMMKIMEILEGNPYAKFFRRLKDYGPTQTMKISIATDAKLDQRVYNVPTADQVAAIWIEGNSTNIPFERYILVHEHSGLKHEVKHYFGCYDPLQYPLLFPNGEIGWQQNLEKTVTQTGNNRREEAAQNEQSALEIFARETTGIPRGTQRHVSCREYYCYKLQIRTPQQSTLLLSGRLLQQYAVDMYIKLETTRLDYFRNKQTQIRSELYQGIVDSVGLGKTQGNQVGQKVILPASFIGGPRDMRRRYMDAMSLVKKYGKPDLFITMTCNPDWEEIKEELFVGQAPQDRPDLTARVFHSKLEDLKDQLFKKCVFGKVAAKVYVIEFQKRGLPHAHILVILQKEYKIHNPDQFDNFISAEIPTLEKDSTLHKMVAKHMMHGPCGELRKSSPCMVKGKCKHHYPRPFCERSSQMKDGYPIYKRIRDQQTVNVRKVNLDNRWVVPHNPYLLRRYNCHINVEVCSTLKAVKYLYKYIYKGHDKVIVHLTHQERTNAFDEISQYQDARWVSSQEAMWRLFEFKLNEMQPAVINLQLHLPNKQTVYYSQQRDLQDVIATTTKSKTMLTEFFKKCRTDNDARHYTYPEFPEHYVWNDQPKVWTRRQNKTVIGRINVANPKEGERYYLRLLLNHVKGPISWEDLLSVDDIQNQTFKEAAQKRGLLEADNSIKECLEEASHFQQPYALRRLFATILVYCEPEGVEQLLEDFLHPMSEDFNHHICANTELRKEWTINSINNFLESMGKTTEMYGLPATNQQFLQNTIQAREIQDERGVETPIADIDLQSRLNPEQQHAYYTILERIDQKTGGVFFIDGPGGTGKTYLYRALLAAVRMKGNIALAAASTGVAASILPGGRTAHTRFKMPVILTDTTMCKIHKQDPYADLIRAATLIIWDEAPMSKKQAMETVDRSLKDIMDSIELFGGKVVVFGGDFRQVLPVIPKGTRAEMVSASMVKSYIWSNTTVFTFTKNMRAAGDQNYAEFLLRVGNGEHPAIEEDQIQLPPELVIKYNGKEDAEQKLIDFVFPSIRTCELTQEYISNRAILSPKNEDVQTLNERLIQMLPGEERVYMSYDKAVDDTDNYYQEEFLNTLMPSGLPPHKLSLKHNCPIMLLRNLDPSNGLCNGTRLSCKGFEKNVLHAQITVGQHAGQDVMIPRIPLSPPDDEHYPFKFQRKQFPVRLCFAMTINKAQGQTIPRVGIYLPQPVFSHGQLYVALSRSTSMETTRVLIKHEQSKRNAETYTKNIVYKEVLLH